MQTALVNAYGNVMNVPPHLFFRDLYNLPGTRDGQTAVLDVPEGLIAVISLNGNVLPNSSYEYVFATVLHEAGHALINRLHTFSSDAAAENSLAHSYQQQIKAQLLAKFTGMSDFDAEALSWGGLETTPYFIANVATIPGFAQAIKDVNDSYRTRAKGNPLPCLTGSGGTGPVY